MLNKSIKTKIGIISLLDDNIIRVQGNSDVIISVEDMFENDRAFKTLLHGKRALFLTIFGRNTTISPEAEIYFGNKERSKIKLAEALVTSQTHHRLSALIHTSNIKPNYPIKAFNSEIDAVKWLLSFNKKI